MRRRRLFKEAGLRARGQGWVFSGYRERSLGRRKGQSRLRAEIGTLKDYVLDRWRIRHQTRK